MNKKTKKILEHLVLRMAVLDPETKEYKECEKKLNALLNLVKNVEETNNVAASRKISKEALLASATNLTGILLILNYEKLGVITSKAFSLLKK